MDKDEGEEELREEIQIQTHRNIEKKKSRWQDIWWMIGGRVMGKDQNTGDSKDQFEISTNFWHGKIWVVPERKNFRPKTREIFEKNLKPRI